MGVSLQTWLVGGSFSCRPCVGAKAHGWEEQVFMLGATSIHHDPAESFAQWVSPKPTLGV